MFSGNTMLFGIILVVVPGIRGSGAQAASGLGGSGPPWQRLMPLEVSKCGNRRGWSYQGAHGDKLYSLALSVSKLHAWCLVLPMLSRCYFVDKLGHRERILKITFQLTK